MEKMLGNLVARANSKARTLFSSMLVLPIILVLSFSGIAGAKIGTKSRPVTDLVVLHSVGGFGCKKDKWSHSGSPKKLKTVLGILANPKHVGGAHILIDRDGNIAASTPIGMTANHVYGRQKKDDKYSYNDRSIGIELLNHGDGNEEFPPKQLSALVSKLQELVKTYGIKRGAIVTHASVDRRKVSCEGEKEFVRRTDPGANFKLKEVLERVFK